MVTANDHTGTERAGGGGMGDAVLEDDEDDVADRDVAFADVGDLVEEEAKNDLPSTMRIMFPIGDRA